MANHPRNVEQLSLNIFDLIDQICADFRKQWKAGKRPQIEELLREVPENARGQLFRNLLTLEIGFRERNGEKPEPHEFSRRFPDEKRAVREAFHFSTSISLEAMRETPASNSADMAMTVDVPAANQIGEYQLIRELGRGGFGVVYEARHIRRGNRVALKTLPTGISGQEKVADRLHRFRNEFRALAEINHPNLVGMQTLEVDDHQWFFTLDLVEGVDFLQWTRPNGNLDESRLRRSLHQLADGIHELHSQGIVHRDLKPSNVLVDSRGTATILDFGLAEPLSDGLQQTLSLNAARFAGTPQYAAPEQFDGRHSEASDWYSFGTMLYQGLTGQLPFDGSFVDLMRRKLLEDAPRLTNRDGLPSDLAELSDQLLRRRPSERGGPSLVARTLGINLDPAASTSVELSRSSQSPAEPTLIGRETQLAQLEDVRKRLIDTGEPIVVFISGRSGEGKSSLVERFLRILRSERKFVVLEGRCYDRESVPFKAVDAIINSLVGYLRTVHPEQINAWLPEDIALLARLFPVLRRVEAIASASDRKLPDLDSEKLHHRSFQALGELLEAIARQAPVVTMIDDLQWGDADSAKVLFDLANTHCEAPVPLLGSYRSDEAENSPLLVRWREWWDRALEPCEIIHVEVGPLTKQQCVEFLASRTDGAFDANSPIIDDLYAETGGNPYILEQLSEGFDTGTRSFQTLSLTEIVERRLARLAPEARRLLSMIAIAGQQLDIDEAAAACGLTGEVMGTLTHMRSERLVRLIGDDDARRVDTYHDRIRENVLSSLECHARRGLHLQLAELIESSEGLSSEEVLDELAAQSIEADVDYAQTDRIFDLAHHYQEANDERAFAYHVAAGEEALRVVSANEARKSWWRAREIMPVHCPQNIRLRIAYGLGESRRLLGHVPEAVDEFKRALELTRTPIEKAKVHLGMASAYHQSAEFSEAIPCCDRALLALGRPRPSGNIRRAAAAIAKAAYVLAIPRPIGASSSPSSISKSRIEFRAQNLLAIMLQEVEGPLAQTLAFISTSRAARRINGDRERVIGDATTASWLNLAGAPLLGAWFSRRSTRLADTLDEVDASGQVAVWSAVCCLFGGDLLGAKVALREAIELVRRSGDSVHLMMAYYGQCSVMEGLESARRLLDEATDLIRLSETIGELRGVCWGEYFSAAALARAGRLNEAKQMARQVIGRFDDHPFLMCRAVCLSYIAFVELQCSDFDAANRLLQEYWTVVRNNFGYGAPFLVGLPFLLESLTGPDWTRRLGRSDGSSARRMLRTNRFWSRRFPWIRCRSLRACGRGQTRLGQSRRAIRSFERAVRVGISQGLGYDVARALLDLAAVKEAGRDENRAEAIELLKKMESVIPRAESWLLGDQYDEAVVAPEFDLEAWEAEHGRISARSDEKDV